MAYQPIQMPQPEGLGGVAEFMMGLQNQREKTSQSRADLLLRQQAQQSEDQHRRALEEDARKQLEMQKELNQQNVAQKRLVATQQITAALDAGRPDLARQIANTFGIPIQENEQPIQQQPGNTLMRPSIDVPNPPQQPGGKDFADQGEVEAQFFKPAGTIPIRQATWQVAGERYDPQQWREAEEAQRARDVERVRGAFGPLGYGEQAAALEGGSTSAKPIDVSGMISKAMEGQQKREQAAAERETQRQFQADQNEAYRRTFPQALAIADRQGQGRADAARISAGAGPKVDAETRGDAAYIERRIKGTAAATGINKLLSQHDSVATALAQLESDSGVGNADALTALARTFRGGVPNMFEDKRLQDHMGGLMAKIEGIAQGAVNGQLADDQKEDIRKAIRSAQAEYEQFIDHRFQTFANGIAKDPLLKNYAGTVNESVRALFTPFGRDVPDVMQGTNVATPLGEHTHAREDVQPSTSTSARQPAPVNPTRKAIVDRTLQQTLDNTEDPNNSAPLAEDPNADELPPIISARQAGVARNAARADALTGKAAKAKITREQAIEELRRRGLIQ